MKYVVSTRIRCGRSVQGLPFNPNMSEAQYEELENLVSTTLKVIIAKNKLTKNFCTQHGFFNPPLHAYVIW